VESAESSSSHDPIDATDKVPSPWMVDEEVDDRPTQVAPPTQRRPIPSIVRRNAVAPLAQPVADRIERASVGAPLHLDTPAPAPAKPRAKPPISSEQTVEPDFAFAKNDITSRRTIPLRAPSVVPVRAKVEIASAPPVVLAPVAGEVEIATAPRLALDAVPATPLVELAPTPVEPAATASEPAPRKAPASSRTRPPAASTFGAGMLQARKHKTKRSVDHDPTLDASSEPPTFGAGMLDAHKVRPKRTAPSEPQPRDTIDRDAAVAFGAGMLQAHKVRTKRDAGRAQATAPQHAGAASTFGAGMLQARKSRASFVVAAVLVVAAITAGYLAMRGDASSSKAAAAAPQNR